jgi:hypothetical protein
MYIVWLEHFFKFKDLKRISAQLPKFGNTRHRFGALLFPPKSRASAVHLVLRFSNNLCLYPGTRVREPGTRATRCAMRCQHV